EGVEGFEAYVAKMWNRIAPPSEVTPELPAALDAPILGAMAKDRDDRPSLDAIVAALAPPVREAPPAPTVRRWPFATLGVSALLFVLSLAFWILPEPSGVRAAAGPDVLRFGYRRSVPDEDLEARFAG